MAHLIHAYGNYLGVTPTDRPILNEQFFPLPKEKYILIHNDNKLSSKWYEYFEDVVNLVKPILHSFGYLICQIGGKNDPPISNVDLRFLGQSWAQTAFIVKNASAVACIDSVIGHTASAYNIPTVCLFSHIYPEQAKPRFIDKLICLEPDRDGKRPSYSAQEDPKTIRTIKVENVANSILELLEINARISMKTIHVGNHYHEPVMEVVPDFFTEHPALKSHLIHFRMDLRHDEQCLAAWLPHYKLNIIANKILNLNLLRQFKGNVSRVTLFLKDEKTFSPQYLKELKAIGLPLVLICDAPKDISSLREKFFDFVIEEDDNKKPLDNVPANAKFWTKKLLFSKGKKFPSTAHWRENIPLTNENSIIDCGEFWKDAQSFYFYQ